MAYDFKDVKVLIVETSPPLYELLKGVLKMFTVPEGQITPAFGAEEAFEHFCKGNHDLVIVDWMQNPDKGLILTQKIRMGDTQNPFVPILMTAGSGHQNRVLRARDAGVSDYLVKPFTAKALAHKIENIIEHPRPFVLCESYVGPDRRRKQVAFEGEDRRMEEPMPAMPVAFRKEAIGEETGKEGAEETSEEKSEETGDKEDPFVVDVDDEAEIDMKDKK